MSTLLCGLTVLYADAFAMKCGGHSIGKCGNNDDDNALYFVLQDACKSADELTKLSHDGQKVMDRLAALKRPLVAAINGACMGGGLEVALAW